MHRWALMCTGVRAEVGQIGEISVAQVVAANVPQLNTER